MQADAELFHVWCDGVLLKTVPRTTRNQVVRYGPTRSPDRECLALQPEIVIWLVGERPSRPAGRAATGDDPIVSPPRDRPMAWSAGSSLRR